MSTQADLQLGEMTAEAVYDTLMDKGVSKTDAAVIASGWIFENFGKVKRTFNYVQPFPAVEPSCDNSFGRSFAHDDWVDGESVVQAETTTGEKGFNARFHDIEKDLDALGADVAKAFSCLAEMRTNLRNLLDEIRAELNRLNSDMHDCCSQRFPPGTAVDPLPNFGGLTSKFLGMSVIDGKNVTMWNTPQGMLMIPAVTPIAGDIVMDPRVKRVSALAQLIEDDPRIRKTFQNQPVSKKELVDRFGNEIAKDGHSIRQLVSILPESATLGNLDLLVQALGEREAAALRTTSGADAAIAAVFGLETRADTVGKSPLDRFSSLPRKARTVLISQNVKTMNEFADKAPVQIAKLLNSQGVETSVGEAAAWVTEAKTLILVR